MAQEPLIFCFYDDFKKVSKIGLPTVHSLEGLKKRELHSRPVIRWGKSNPIEKRWPGKKEFKHVLNKASSIKLNCQKRRALEKMSRVVETPRLFKRHIPAKTLAVVRPHTHAEGCQFSVIEGPLYLSNGYYGTEYLRTKREVRVWFTRIKGSKGYTLSAIRAPIPDQPKEEFPCRSRWGYRFISHPPRKLHNQVLVAAEAIGLDFGAADVLIMGKDRFVVVELNSCPTVDNVRIREFYRATLLKVVRERFPRIKIQVSRKV